MAEQHAVGRGERQGVAGAFLPRQVTRAGHQLPVLHTGELGEGSVRRLVAPDALRGGEHRIAAIAFLVIAVVLVAMDHDLVTDLPALDAGTDGIDHAGGIGTGNVIGLLVDVEGRQRGAEGGPDAVVVDAGSHHQDQHVMAVQFRRVHDLALHGGVGIAMALPADRPGVHLRRYVTQGRNLAHFIEVTAVAVIGVDGGVLDCLHLGHAHYSNSARPCSNAPVAALPVNTLDRPGATGLCCTAAKRVLQRGK